MTSERGAPSSPSQLKSRRRECHDVPRTKRAEPAPGSQGPPSGALPLHTARVICLNYDPLSPSPFASYQVPVETSRPTPSSSVLALSSTPFPRPRTTSGQGGTASQRARGSPAGAPGCSRASPSCTGATHVSSCWALRAASFSGSCPAQAPPLWKAAGSEPTRPL